MEGRYLSAKRPLLPPASNPPGLKRVANSPPQPSIEGICFTLLWYTPGKLIPSAVRSTFVGSLKTFGKVMKVYPKTVSFVSVGEKTWVRLADIDSDSFLPTISVGYGT